jgi:anaerobic magnesium-protoporphyrin IX monomethyl ester cyclase
MTYYIHLTGGFMKVLLINPPWPGKGIGTRSQNRIIKQRADMYVQYPIMMGYSCAVLKRDGHEVIYIDSVLDGLGYEETTKRIKQFGPDVIVMETVTPSFKYDIGYINEMKKATGAFMVVTGPHVSFFGEQSLKDCSGIDVAIKGEYDTSIDDVVKAIGNPGKLRKIKGLSFRNGKKLEDTGPASFSDDLDSLPFPDRETIPFQKYGESWYNKKPFMNILTSRGCPYGCSFCISAHIMEGLKWRTRSIKNVMEELSFAVKEYGVKEINIDDPTFTIGKKRVMEFCRELRKNGFRLLWTCNGRVDNVDDEMLGAMKKSGCKMIRYGVESGDQEVLNRMGKKLTLDQIKKGFSMTRKHGILALGGFMFGFPYDSRETVEKTIQFAKEIKPDLIQASIVMPYPGTKLYDEARKEGKLLVKDWREFDMTCGTVIKTIDMEKGDLDGILSRMYREFYFRPGFVLQTIFNTRRFSDMTRILRTFKTLVKTQRFYSGGKDEN